MRRSKGPSSSFASTRIAAVVTVLEGTVRAANDLGAVVVGAGQQAVAQRAGAAAPGRCASARRGAMGALLRAHRADVDVCATRGDSRRESGCPVFRSPRWIPSWTWSARGGARRPGSGEKLDPGYGDAYALRAITAVALNEKTQALENGRLAVQRAPNSTSARLALSYALQSNFDLEAARSEVEAAVAAAPDDAASLARLAELRLMLDDIRGAAQAADRAVARAPQLARAHTSCSDSRDLPNSFSRRRGLRTGHRSLHDGSAGARRSWPRQDSRRQP